MKMMVISATEFKAKCLQLMDRVNATGERIQVTKRGKVVAELCPPPNEVKSFAKAGSAKDWLKITGDIMEPIDIEWEAMK